MKFKKIIFTLILITLSINSHASYLVYDIEVDDVLKEIARPLLKTANLDNVEIKVINDASINAFTDGKNIYLNSGLIAKFSDPNVIRCVIAHEIAHIKLNHVQNFESFIDYHNKLSLPAILIAGIIGTATANPALAISSFMFSNHISSRNILKFSRENETSADLLAFDLLQKNGYSPNGLIILFKFIENLFAIEKEHRYDLTHPISNERIQSINFKIKQNKSLQNNESKEIKRKFERISAKLAVYFENNPDISIYGEEAKIYANSVLQLKKSNKSEAIKYIDKILANNPEDIYLILHKAEILSYFGDKNFFKYFEKAISLKPSNSIKKDFALKIITLSDDKEYLKNAIFILENIYMSGNLNIHDSHLLYYISLGYDKIGKKGESLYYKAKFYHLNNDNKKASIFANNAKRYLDKNSVYMLRADDIILLSE